MKYIIFDVKVTYSENLAMEKFALASECGKTSSRTVLFGINQQTIQVPFHTVYSKQARQIFYMKFWLAVDVDTKYLLNGFPYLGKDEQRPSDVPLAEHVVLRLMDQFLNKRRNKLNVKKTSLVRTMNLSRREVSKSAMCVRQALHNTTVFRNNDITLTVYQGKVNKNVIVMSTPHGNNEKKTPETFSYYNNTMYGVDILDQMARLYSMKSGSRRWPLHVFFNIPQSTKWCRHDLSLASTRNSKRNIAHVLGLGTNIYMRKRGRLRRGGNSGEAYGSLVAALSMAGSSGDDLVSQSSGRAPGGDRQDGAQNRHRSELIYPCSDIALNPPECVVLKQWLGWPRSLCALLQCAV
ncbi:hypothetical protein PR048_012912 [Dryococelus australis]|uniref:PiggyBac transposable element-derived protein domain-containing protein n=1 Tax=Dryococelus australis TaxID=614101 RepID=A0ABQ9HR01_9NEOP|nr:hypothetical protein PR048_012912 [Dryococelus australis]